MKSCSNGFDVRKGFTILELLIVLAIIAILVSLTISMAVGAKRNAKIKQAQAETRALVTAIRAYRVEYDRWPVLQAGGMWTNNDNHALVFALTAQDSEKNPRLINFMEVADPSASYCDPWKTGTAYRVEINGAWNFVRVWSPGPNGKEGDGDDVQFRESQDLR